jgi:DNA-binding transcriptional ArsR family regulator
MPNIPRWEDGSVASRTATPLQHPGQEALQFAEVLAALADPLRLAIVAELAALPPDEELMCGAFTLPTSKSTQSAHFRVLREAGIIRQRDEGTRRLNRLRRDDLDARFPGLLDLVLEQGRPFARVLARGHRQDADR